METYSKKYIRTIRLNSFHPLCETRIGRNAMETFGYPPFIDASCRREPDFENPFPSITALCRQDKFAPQLVPNDLVIYITVKGNWLESFEHYRIIAILEVIERKETHSEAKSWYSHRGIPLPSNCMVEDNLPHSFIETAGNYDTETEIERFLISSGEKQRMVGERRIKLWDDQYRAKSRRWGVFIITRPVFINLSDPPILRPDDIISIFGKKINTRMPKKISRLEFKALAAIADIDFVEAK